MDKIELQRLIDGELDHADRRRLLRQIDEQPSQWRMIALALLEEQAFRGQIVSTSVVADSRLESSTTNQLAIASKPSNTVKTQSSKPRSNAWLQMAAAASLLLASGFLGGNYLASHFDRDGMTSTNPASMIASSETATNQPTPENQAGIDNATFVSLKPVGQLSFASDSTHNQIDNSAMQIPIYEAGPGHVENFLQAQQQQFAQWNEQLRRRGYELDWKPEMLESRLPDGRSVIVPIQQVNVRSLGQ